MKKKVWSPIIFVALIGAWGLTCFAAEGEVTLFCGAAFKKPMEEIVEAFQKKADVKVSATYAGVGTLFSQLLLTRQGDVFVAPSPDIFETAMEKGLIIPDSVRNMAFVVPCIDVQKGNPGNITGLKDLLKPGTKVAIGNPEIVYVGALAAEIAQKAFTESERSLFKKNIVTYAEDFNKLATFLVLKQVDAIIGFHFLEAWYPDKVEMVKLKVGEIERIGSAKAALVSYTKDREKAQQFIDFLFSPEAKAVLQKYHYFNSADEAFAWLGGRKPIGGSYPVSGEWIGK